MSNKPEPDILQEILRTRKYRRISRDLLERLAAEERAKRRNPKDATKSLKRRLHEICGAFLPETAFERANRLFESMEQEANDAPQFLADCGELLSLHASTAERLPIYPRFYADILNITGRPRTVLDIACGFHPFSIPFMGENVPERYFAWEIDVETVSLLNRFLPLAGLESLAGAQDCVSTFPEEQGDLAFFLKSVPTFERQRKGAGMRLIAEIRARWVVVSFASKTLGGRSKGMAKHYEAVYGSVLERDFRVAGRFDYDRELVYVLEKESAVGREQ